MALDRVRLRCLRLLAIGLAVIGLCQPGQASTSITGVQIEPTQPTPTEAILLQTSLQYPNANYGISSNELRFLSPTQIQVDLVVLVPGIGLPAIRSETVDTPLGTLPIGEYDYTVRVYELAAPGTPGTPIDPAVLVDTRAGTFNVVPEPATLTLFVLGGWALTRRQRQP